MNSFPLALRKIKISFKECSKGLRDLSWGITDQNQGRSQWGGRGGRLPPRTPKIGKESKNREGEKGGKERKKRERKRKGKEEEREREKEREKEKGKKKRKKKGKEKRREERGKGKKRGRGKGGRKGREKKENAECLS